ncbi:hypothetical protein K1719_024598 [Acacia pycnantha]|nr:hypothetical protein K1719_024598 [Acacia pycnantha]
MDPWGVSTTLKLYDDPWKVKKVLTENDTSNKNGVTLRTQDVTQMVLPMLGDNAEAKAQTACGAELWFWDVDTQSSYKMLLKKTSQGSYRITGPWNKSFNKRRKLKARDEIGLQWDRYNNRFNFSVIKRT